jgi:hypothetical protein
MLSSELPGLRTSAPGNIQDERLPELRHLVLVDNQDVYSKELDELGLRSVVDWRETLLWSEGTSEARQQVEISESLQKDEVINLQFTRSV